MLDCCFIFVAVGEGYVRKRLLVLCSGDILIWINLGLFIKADPDKWWYSVLPTLNYLLTHLFIPYSRVLEKLIGSHLVKKFPAFYGTRRFIIAFTRARHLSICWGSSIQSMPKHPTSWRSILILFSHLRLGLLSGLFQVSPPQPCICLSSPSYVLHAPTISFSI